jgi:NAD(P)H-nitrite reductase large subunit
MGDNPTTARNAVAERLEPLVDFYIERGDGDERTVMLIEALGEIDHLHTALQRSTIQKQDWRLNLGGTY